MSKATKQRLPLNVSSCTTTRHASRKDACWVFDWPAKISSILQYLWPFKFIFRVIATLFFFFFHFFVFLEHDTLLSDYYPTEMLLALYILFCFVLYGLRCVRYGEPLDWLLLWRIVFSKSKRGSFAAKKKRMHNSCHTPPSNKKMIAWGWFFSAISTVVEYFSSIHIPRSKNMGHISAIIMSPRHI